MLTRKRIASALFVLTLALLVPRLACAQNTAAATASVKQDKGFFLFETAQGSSNSFGQVMRLDTTAGVNWNKFFNFYGGVPVYFVRPSNSSTGGYSSSNGLGDLYLGVGFNLRNPVLNYASSLTGFIPTGDTNAGLSTGRFTFDWNNHFDRGFGSLIPFANIGVSNSINDTLRFTRPFTTLGMVSHFEGGAAYRLFRFLDLNASVYAFVPAGDQKVYSRLVHRNTGPFGTSSHNRVFATNAVTSGGADIARDDGFSTWATLYPVRVLDLELGYTRSVRYDLNTIFFTARLNVGALIRGEKGRK